ncbi:MAG: M23 family metallopeptidase [Myxococcales bacterium]|nr:M23 family metallopeptidase [Myxococcales bacterium]
MGPISTGSIPQRFLSASALIALMIALVPPSALSEPPALVKEAGNATRSPALKVALPDKWLPSKGRQCYRRGKYRGFCEGPRRVPAPHGEAAALAERLRLGEIKTVSHLMLKAPEPEWVEAAGPDRGERLLWPVVGGKLWRGFGKVRRGPKRKKRHKGIDIGAPEGTLLRAAKSGLVAYSDNGVRGYGNLLVTVHPDATVAFYAHARALYVFPGERVERGQIIGEVGHTGIARGAHLHFEYRRRGRPRDPLRKRGFEGRPDL